MSSARAVESAPPDTARTRGPGRRSEWARAYARTVLRTVDGAVFDTGGWGRIRTADLSVMSRLLWAN
jgi:hypothetical protein